MQKLWFHLLDCLVYFEMVTTSLLMDTMVRDYRREYRFGRERNVNNGERKYVCYNYFSQITLRGHSE